MKLLILILILPLLGRSQCPVGYRLMPPEKQKPVIGVLGCRMGMTDEQVLRWYRELDSMKITGMCEKIDTTHYVNNPLLSLDGRIRCLSLPESAQINRRKKKGLFRWLFN